MFLLLLRDISWGFRHLAPNFLFTSLVWQPSCRLGIKQSQPSSWTVSFPWSGETQQYLVTYFPAVFVGFTDRVGQAAFWWEIHWKEGRESNYLASVSRGGAMLDRCPLVDAPDIVVFSLFRQESSLKTTHGHRVFCPLYNHWLLISQILDIQSSDLPIRSSSLAANPRGFPEGSYFGSWLLPGATCKSILPSFRALCNNLQVRCLLPRNGNSCYSPRPL